MFARRWLKSHSFTFFYDQEYNLGEYPARHYDIDGFIKRLFDYVEFDRYEEKSPLR